MSTASRYYHSLFLAASRDLNEQFMTQIDGELSSETSSRASAAAPSTPVVDEPLFLPIAAST